MKNVIITGAAGFIGSNLAQKLLADKNYNVFLVEDLENLSDKFENMKTLYTTSGWSSHSKLRSQIELFLNSTEGKTEDLQTTIVHLGANSSTTEKDVGKILTQNTEFSIELMNALAHHKDRIKIIFASSASVYGNTQKKFGSTMAEPLCPYAYSKYLVDKYLTNISGCENVVSLRFFNVYGQFGEGHKGGQASVFHHFTKQLKTEGLVRLFEAPKKETISRDFVHVDDVCRVIKFFLDNENKHGIYDVGTGVSRTFEDVADVCSYKCSGGEVPATKTYIKIPDEIKDAYQFYTKADLTRLREAGYEAPFLSIEQGWN